MRTVLDAIHAALSHWSSQAIGNSWTNNCVSLTFPGLSSTSQLLLLSRMAEYTLYGFWRSSCTARLRIALNIKGIHYTVVCVDLSKDEHLSFTHKELNPSASVPLLLRQIPNCTLKIGQSLAALEYLEEAHSETGEALLPPSSDIRGRATVRVLANIIACDNQPVTNVRIMKRVSGLGGDAEEWNRGLMRDSLAAYEATAVISAGTYSYGDKVTIADACLVPAVWNALRFKVDLMPFVTITRIMANLEELEAVKKAHPSLQPDTPPNFR